MSPPGDGGAGAPSVSGSEYIRWAKERERFTYNLARSSLRPCPPELLGAGCEDLALSAANAWGWPPLLAALAERYGVTTGQVVLASGTSLANHLVYAALLEPGDHVLIETPRYEPLEALAHYFRAQVTTFPRRRQDGYAVDLDAVRSRLRHHTRLVVVTDLHNPSGRALSEQSRRGLLELAERSGAWVLFDEVYREFLTDGRPAPAAALSERAVSTCSLTKAYGLDALRAGWILAPPRLARRLRLLGDLFGVIQPHPCERLALRALRRIDRLGAATRALLERNRRLVEEFVGAREQLEWLPPTAGPIAFVRLLRGSVERLQRTLETRYDAAVAPGAFFGAEDCFRLGFGMETATLRCGLERLAAALDELNDGRSEDDGTVR